jgi:hypothetical protein
MNFNKFIGAGVALASSTLVLGSTMSAPAQAYTLSAGSSLTFSGPATFSGGTATFGAGNGVVLSSTGGFTLPPAIIGIPGSPLSTVKAYPASSALPTTFEFFNSGISALKFVLNAPLVLTPGVVTGSATSQTFLGTFFGNGGTAYGDGTLSIQPTAGGSYTAGITVVPEPFTILGTATALGFGAFMKSKKKKEDKVSV